MGSWLAPLHSDCGRPAEYVGRLFWHGWRRELSEVPLILTRPGCSGQKGQRHCLRPVSAERDPILPSTPGWVKHTNPSRHRPCPSPGHQPVFWSHFSPPTCGRCSNTSGTCWHLGNNELLNSVKSFRTIQNWMNCLRKKSNNVGFLSTTLIHTWFALRHFCVANVDVNVDAKILIRPNTAGSHHPAAPSCKKKQSVNKLYGSERIMSSTARAQSQRLQHRWA